MRALDGDHPRLSSSRRSSEGQHTELIRAIRGRKPLQDTPILLTVSGYKREEPESRTRNASAPRTSSPSLYSETEFLGKVAADLGVIGDATNEAHVHRDLRDLVDARSRCAQEQTGTRTTGDVDKMLSDTLGVMMPKRRDAAPTVAVPKPQQKVPARSTRAQRHALRAGETQDDAMAPERPRTRPRRILDSAQLRLGGGRPQTPAKTERFDTAKMQLMCRTAPSPTACRSRSRLLTPIEPARVFEDEEPATV